MIANGKWNELDTDVEMEEMAYGGMVTHVSEEKITSVFRWARGERVIAERNL